MAARNALLLKRLGGNKRLLSSLVLILMIVLLSFLLVTGGFENTGIFWFSTFPLLAFFFKGKKRGILWIFLLISVESIILILNHRDFLRVPYSVTTLQQAFFSFVIVSLLAFSYEYIRDHQTNQLKKIATTDALTKAHNRMKITEVLEHEVEITKRYSAALSLIMFDIDHFKVINDSYGHQTGDLVLMEIADIVRADTRITDYFGRWGGEEFILVLPQTNLVGTKILADRLARSIETHKFDDIEKVTASFGVTEFQEGDNINSLIKRVDNALYRAKEGGRNLVADL